MPSGVDRHWLIFHQTFSSSSSVFLRNRRRLRRSRWLGLRLVAELDETIVSFSLAAADKGTPSERWKLVSTEQRRRSNLMQTPSVGKCVSTTCPYPNPIAANHRFRSATRHCHGVSSREIKWERLKKSEIIMAERRILINCDEYADWLESSG